MAKPVAFIGLLLLVVSGLLICAIRILRHHDDAAHPTNPVRRLDSPAQSGDSSSAASIISTSRSVPHIEPGTCIDDGQARGWSHLVLIARPRLEPDDAAAVGPTVAALVELLFFAITAQVEHDKRQAMLPYRLRKVAVGIGTRIDGRQIVVSTSTQSALGAALSPVSYQVLSENERALARYRQIATTPGMAVVDTMAVVAQANEHREMVIRYAVLVDRDRGTVAALAWLLDRDGDEFRTVEPNLQLLRSPAEEDRIKNVRMDRFFLGIPAKDAFAVRRIPRGEPIAFSRELRALAALPEFTPKSADELERALGAEMNTAVEERGNDAARDDQSP